MLRVHTDFNARAKDDVCFLLNYHDEALEKQAADLHLAKGDKVLLYQDVGDFEVTAVLDFRYVDILNRETWVAVPDWSTMVRK